MWRGFLDLVVAVVVVVVAVVTKLQKGESRLDGDKERKQRSQQECSRQADAQQRVIEGRKREQKRQWLWRGT